MLFALPLRQSPSLAQQAPGVCLFSCCFITSRHAMLAFSFFCSWVWGTECCKVGILPAELSQQLPVFIFNLFSQHFGQSTWSGADGQVFSTELHSQPQPSQVNTCRCLSSLLITCFKMFSITFIYCGSGAWVCHSAHVEVRESTQVGPLFLPCGTRGWTSVIRLGGMCLLYLLSYPWSTESTEGGMVACNPSTLTQLKTGGC